MKKCIITKETGVEAEKNENSVLLKIQSDKEIAKIIAANSMNLQEVKSNLPVLLQVMEDHAKCSACKGLALCQKERGQYCLGLRRSENGFIPYIDSCPMKKRLVEIESRYIECSLPDEWKTKRIDSIEKMEIRKPLLREIIHNLDGTISCWTFVNGNRGCGRSFILGCYANEFADNMKEKVAFVDSCSWINKLKDLYYTDNGQEKFNARINDFSTCALLVLDDFGNEQVTEWCFSNILFPILNSRAKQGLRTAFSSDFTITEIADLYASKLGPFRGKQMKSLLNGMCQKEYVLEGVNLTGVYK